MVRIRARIMMMSPPSRVPFCPCAGLSMPGYISGFFIVGRGVRDAANTSVLDDNDGRWGSLQDCSCHHAVMVLLLRLVVPIIEGVEI